MDNVTASPIVISNESSPQQLVSNIFSVLICSLCATFDVLLLAATYQNRGDSTLPSAYITVMCLTGITVSLSECAFLASYLVLSEKAYQDFLVIIGKEVTLIGTYSYLTAFFVSALMTGHRLIVVIKPFRTNWFTHKRIFLYSAIIAILLMISMLIPYFSPCSVTFNAIKLSFISGCAPERHPVTTFQNKYFIVVPFTCMFINLGLINHLRFFRDGKYARIANFFRRKRSTSNVTSSSQPAAITKLQARRDFIMMRQTVSVAVFLSIYEFGAFLMRMFPNEYASLPKSVRDGFFYFRFLSIPILNYFIYYIETESTRRMFRRFLGLSNKGSDSNGNLTVVTVVPRRAPERRGGSTDVTPVG